MDSNQADVNANPSTIQEPVADAIHNGTANNQDVITNLAINDNQSTPINNTSNETTTNSEMTHNDDIIISDVIPLANQATDTPPSSHSPRRSEKRPVAPRTFLLSGDVSPDASAIISRLGGTALPPRGPFAAGATHLLTSSLRRTEKYLGAVACGLWVVKPSYLTACEQANQWVDETPFEWDEAAADSHIDPACLRRRRREGGGVFRGARVILVGTLVPGADTWKRIIEAAGGSVAITKQNITQAVKRLMDEPSDGPQLCVLPADAKETKLVKTAIENGFQCVPTSYLLDLLSKDPAPPVDSYLLFHEWTCLFAYSRSVVCS